MMDPDLDDLLRRYRPAGPPPELRARVVGATTPAGRTWPWVAAAAVLLAATVGLQVWTRDVYDAVGAALAPAQASILADFEALDNAVEGDPLLRERLEALARQERLQSRPTLFEPAPSWQ
jgi:hypothetical protein